MSSSVAGRKWSAFQLMDTERALRISQHRFYVEQAKARLLSQFSNIEAEADQAENDAWELSGRFFDPDRHDPGEQAEAARDRGFEVYQLLSDMRDRTRLSVVAGMYHHWDKTVRRFLVREFRWPRLVIGDHTRRALWKMDSTKLEQLLRALGLDLQQSSSYCRLDAMRLVVNVFKHGEGQSLDALRSKYPEFLRPASTPFMPFDDDDMVVTDQHVDHFAAAIEGFWQYLPPELTFADDVELALPDEFEKAWKKDLAAQSSA